jgi:hypothetical protein
MMNDPDQVHNLVFAATRTATKTSDGDDNNGDDNSNNPRSILPVLYKLSNLLATLGSCKGSQCYDLDDHHDDDDDYEKNIDNTTFAAVTADYMLPRVMPIHHFSFESIQDWIRERIPCHNPPSFHDTAAAAAAAVENNNRLNSDQNIGRKPPFAYNRYVPEPFTDGFPFSDGDDVGEDLLKIWSEYEHYFY